MTKFHNIPTLNVNIVIIYTGKYNKIHGSLYYNIMCYNGIS